MPDQYLKNKKILIVDDEPELLTMLISLLEEDGYKNIITADTVKKSLILCNEEKPDIAVLDVMLPDGDGFFLMQEIRKFSNMPIIFLTAKDALQDKFSGFGLGADDYITKPFFPQELLYRLNAVLRRCYRENSSVIKLHNSVVYMDRAQVIKNNVTFDLTAKEHSILKALYKNANHIVTVDCLCEEVWGDNPFGYGNSLMAHIRRLREKIELNPSAPVSLVTVKGLGYKLITAEG